MQRGGIRGVYSRQDGLSDLDASCMLVELVLINAVVLIELGADVPNLGTLRGR
jgi:hypothetical protein